MSDVHVGTARDVLVMREAFFEGQIVENETRDVG